VNRQFLLNASYVLPLLLSMVVSGAALADGCYDKVQKCCFECPQSGEGDGRCQIVRGPRVPPVVCPKASVGEDLLELASESFNQCYDKCDADGVREANNWYPGGRAFNSKLHPQWVAVRKAIKNSCMDRENCDSKN
jgi:hypothetical protein